MNVHRMQIIAMQIVQDAVILLEVMSVSVNQVIRSDESFLYFGKNSQWLIVLFSLSTAHV